MIRVRRCWLRTLLLASLAALPTGTARADDAALAGAGGNLALIKGHKSVRMIGEVVRIKLPECKVNARFVFKNEGAATTVRIGFPETGKNLPPHHDTNLEDFRSWVNGKKVSTKHVFTYRPHEGTDEEGYSA